MSIEIDNIEYQPSWIQDYAHLIPQWVFDHAYSDAQQEDTKRVVIRAVDIIGESYYNPGESYYIGVDRHHSNGTSGTQSNTREFIIPK